MDYKDYSAEDFLKDEFFIQWIKKGNPETRHFWESWLESHPEKKADINRAREIADSIRYKKRATPDLLLYNGVLEAIYKEENYRSRIGQDKKQRWFPSTTRVAATLLFLLVSGLVFWVIYKQNLAPSNGGNANGKIVKESPLGTKTTFMLEDGTKIQLNAGSRITYDKSFGFRDRRVFLEGEAFFEVAKDSLKPFIVTTENLQTRVYGTSFNISAYPDEPAIQIALVTGKVTVTDESGSIISKLSPKQMASFSKAGQDLKIMPFRYLDVVGWKDGLIVFNKASFAEVMNVLSRWFDVQFKLTGGKHIQGKFTGEFNNKTLREIMEGLSFATDFNFEIKGKEVVIK